MVKDAVKPTHVNDTKSQPAGAFSQWLQMLRKARQHGTLGSDVPCGKCTACCRASSFIHVRPNEKQTLQHIPKGILFPAPGLPKGNVLMGYNEKGECPMLVRKRCTIYSHRPQTCRDYDCRIFAAAGIAPEGATQAEVAKQVKLWRFAFPNDADHRDFSAVRAAAEFVTNKRDCFPSEFLPTSPMHLALLSIRVYEIFLPPNTPSDPSQIAKQIVAMVDKNVPAGDG